MSLRLAAALLAVVTAAEARAATFRETSMPLPDGSTLLYAISLPDDFKPGEPRPLILALHPGGERMRYYGAAYARMMVAPAAAGLRAIIVAPDCPTRSWIDPAADRAVMALLEAVMREHAVDRKRVLVTGYSLGGRGTWFMASHHPDLFTAAVPMAAAIGDEPLDRLATMPTYIVHSRDDEVVPFAPAERTARALAKMGRPVKFEALWKLTHFQMDLYVPSLRRAMRWISERW
jgi:predicted peptidase